MQKILTSAFFRIVFYIICSLSIYSTILYAKYDFLAVDIFKVSQSQGISFDDVLRLKSSKLVNPIHFKIDPLDDLFNIQLKHNNYKYLTVHVNYLSTRDPRIEINHISNGMLVSKGTFTLKAGKNIYNIALRNNIDTIIIKSANETTFTAGISGLNLDTVFTPDFNIFLITFLLTLPLILHKLKYSRKALIYISTPIIEYFIVFKKFCSFNINGIFLLVALIFATFGFMIFNFTLSIDEELEMMGPRDIGWVGYGRFGTYFLNKILMVNERFTPFLTDFSAAAILGLAVLLLLLNLELNGRQNDIDNTTKKTLSIGLFGGFFITVPLVIAEYMSFGVYNFAIGLGYVLVAMSIYFSESFLKNKRYSDFFWAVFFLAIAISFYQSFISLYVSCITINLLMVVLNDSIISKASKNIQRILYCFLILMLSIGIYLILNMHFQNTITPAYGYIGNIIGWNKGLAPLDVTYGVFEKIFNILLGKIESAGLVIQVTTFTFITYIALRALLTCSAKPSISILIFGLFFILSPFLLNFGLGSELPGRALQALPFFMGAAWYIFFNLPIGKGEKYILVPVSIFLIFFQVQHINQMFYGDHLRYQQDVFLGRQLMQTLANSNIDYKKNPIVFIGSRRHDNSVLISKTNSGGKSFFEDRSQMYRMTYFLGSLGYSVITPTHQEIIEGKKMGTAMPIWPDPHSMKIENGMILVKLSNE